MLANNEITDLYTISKKNWESINSRVGNVFKLKNLEDVVSKTIPGYPDLLDSSELWSQSTFKNLISQSVDLADYADKAIANFSELNNQVKEIKGDEVPIAIQNQTKSLLISLADDTKIIANSANNLDNQVEEFMKDNTIVDKEMSLNSSSIGIFWEPLGEIITSVEIATSKVTGAWEAIEDDVAIAIDKEVSITMPFIMSLDLDASIILWQRVSDEARAFPSEVEGMKSFWNN